MGVARLCSLPFHPCPRWVPSPSQSVGMELFAWEERLSLGLGQRVGGLDGVGGWAEKAKKPKEQKREEG